MSSEQTPNQEQSVATTQSVAAASTFGAKDLLVPISIIIAGAFVGLGLFLSGGAGGGAVAQAPSGYGQQAQAEPADTTDQVLAVSENDWIKGNPDAPVKIVEYSDFDCPFCSRFHTTMDEVVEESDGQVAWVYRHFPLEQLHPQAAAVSLAAECVGEQLGAEGFWTFTDRYFEVRGARDATPHSELIPQLVIEAGANQVEFQSCFEAGTHGPKIQSHIDNAITTGGRGTPWSIIIGPNGDTYPINGAQTKQSVEQLVNLALQEA